ncbi:hypothetical protein LCGC14_0664330 [marine sediment metagenome]|uniref:DUF551 domain-containing protein n=1 Tax=marine sediment metagenome TaxID=412755 RepID=A0A0F9RCX8_9ZZZZ
MMSELTKHLEWAKKYLWDSRNPKLGHANACLDAALAEAEKLEKDNDAQKKSLEASAIALNTQVAEIEQLQAKLDAISDLCENCTTLGDAQYIASGQGKTSTDDGCDKCMVDERDKIIEQLQAKLDKLRWIPVSEGLPENIATVWVLLKAEATGILSPGMGFYGEDDEGMGWDILGPTILHEVTHWMPIILPDKEEAGDAQS